MSQFRLRRCPLSLAASVWEMVAFTVKCRIAKEMRVQIGGLRKWLALQPPHLKAGWTGQSAMTCHSPGTRSSHRLEQSTAGLCIRRAGLSHRMLCLSATPRFWLNWSGHELSQGTHKCFPDDLMPRHETIIVFEWLLVTIGDSHSRGNSKVMGQNLLCLPRIPCFTAKGLHRMLCPPWRMEALDTHGGLSCCRQLAACLCLSPGWLSALGGLDEVEVCLPPSISQYLRIYLNPHDPTCWLFLERMYPLSLVFSPALLSVESPSSPGLGVW